MKYNPIVILGAGIIGRFAKMLMPEAEVYERKHKSENSYTCNYLMGNLSRLPVPELQHHKLILRSYINGEIPNTESIKKYKESKTGSSNISYGDLKQFIFEQAVYAVGLPKVDVNYEKDVDTIDPLTKEIVFKDGSVVQYGCIINTIPLKNVLKLISFWKDKEIDSFFQSKPIFYKESISRVNLLGEQIQSGVIHVDYLATNKTSSYRKTKTQFKESEESFFEIEGAVKILPGKILFSPQAEEIAQDLHLYSIYCYGRYGRWRTAEHLHETFKNLRRFSERKGQIGYC